MEFPNLGEYHDNLSLAEAIRIYQEIELFDKPGLFSNGRIARDNLPEGVYCYDLRLSLIHIFPVSWTVGRTRI